MKVAVIIYMYIHVSIIRLLMKCQASGPREEGGKTVTAALQLARKHCTTEIIPLYKQAVSNAVLLL